MSKNSIYGTRYLSTKKVATLGVFTALSLITFMLESILPPLFLPGAKLGLSNIFTIMTLLMYTPYDAILLVIIRTTLGCIIIGNISALIYSLSAGLVSVVISSILVRFIFPKISILSISIVSAVIHNIVQVLIFCLIINSSNMIAYLPYFALIGVFSGSVVGLIVYLLIHKIPLSYFTKALNQNIDKKTSENSIQEEKL